MVSTVPVHLLYRDAADIPGDLGIAHENSDSGLPWFHVFYQYQGERYSVCRFRSTDPDQCNFEFLRAGGNPSMMTMAMVMDEVRMAFCSFFAEFTRQGGRRQ